MKLSRGDVVIAAFPGELGKRRPAVILQADELLTTYTTALACPFTTHLLDAPLLRPLVQPTEENGLQHLSQMMVEKITPIRKEVIAQRVGHLSIHDMTRLEAALVYVVGLAQTVTIPEDPER